MPSFDLDKAEALKSPDLSLSALPEEWSPTFWHLSPALEAPLSDVATDTWLLAKGIDNQRRSVCLRWSIST